MQSPFFENYTIISLGEIISKLMPVAASDLQGWNPGLERMTHGDSNR